MGTINTTLIVFINTLNVFFIFNCIPWFLIVFFFLEMGPQIVWKYLLEKLKDNQSMEQAAPYQGLNNCIIYQHCRPILVSAPKCVNPYRPYNPQTILSDTSPIIALSCQSLTESVSALFDQNCKLDWSKLLHVFLLLLNGSFKIDTWISLSCYMDLSKLIHGFLLVITWIYQNW